MAGGGTPKISVLTSTFNRPFGLLAAMRRVEAQTFRDFEQIVIADHCPEAQRVYDHEQTERTRFVNLPENHNDLGVTPLNEGLKLARGEWIAVLADDNLIAREHLARLHEVAEKNPDAGLIWGCCELRHKAGKQRGFPQFRDEPWLTWRGVDLGECLYHRTMFEKYGPWEYASNYSFDWQKIEQIKLGGEKCVHVPDCHTFIFYVDDDHLV